MEIIKSLNKSKVLVVSESYFKKYDSPSPFMEEQSSIAVRVGLTTSLPQFSNPDLIEVRNPLNVDIQAEEVTEILDIIKANNYEYVICIGRKPVMWFFNSLSKGRTMEEMTNSPLLVPSEFPNLKVGVLPHYKSAFAKDSEDALTDYWDKFKALFSDRPKYNATETKIETEEEFCQLLDFLDSLPENTLLGLDYETNAVDQFNKDFQVTMYGLAYLVDNQNANGYWYHPPENKPLSEKAMKRWKAFLDKNYKRIWAYNCGFEIKTTWDQVGEMYRMQDAMVLMTVQGKRGSLKNVARTELGTSIWESSVHNFMEITEAMFKYTKRSKNRELIEEMFRNHDLSGLRKLHDNFDKWFNQILESYEESDILHAIDNYPYVWASVPPHVLGPYCAKDAGLALLLVANFNDPEYQTAYDFCIYHPWLAVKFEVNGAPWNDGIAEKLEYQMGKEMLEHLYNVIINLSTVSEEEKMLAIETYNRELPYEVISYTEKTKKERRTLIKTNYDKVEILKTIFNPGSNTAESRAKFWDAYLNNDIILGTIMNIFTEDMEFNQCLKPLYAVVGTDYVNTHTIHEIVSKFSEPEAFLTDQKIIDQCKRSLLKATKEYPEHLGKFSTDLVKNQYQVHSRWLGLDIDNRETWSKEFALLFDLFMFKKIAKTVSSNINGKTGRALVTEVVGEKWGKPLRGRAFSEKPEDESWAGVDCVLNSTFNTLAADTLRWSSSIHTIPAGSEIRRVLKPKAKDEVMLHCLTGDTLICTNKGNIPISELVDRFNNGEQFNVKARKSDKLKHEAKIQPITRAFESKKVTETIKLTFENGKSVECTPDHKFLTADGTWIEAKDIDENTELMESAPERKRKLKEYVKQDGRIKIVSKEIIKYSEPIPVYDLTIGYDNSRSNFELECGVISKNCDFATLEVCCIAFMSQDEKMLEALFSGKDMHKFAASLMYDKPESEVTGDERKSAKACLFEGNKIKLLNNELVDISELENKVGEWCYGSNLDGEIVPAKILHWEKTKFTDDKYKITLDDGQELFLTSDHPLMLKTGVYRQVKDILIGDSLMPFYSEIDKKGYEVIHDIKGKNYTYRKVREYCNLDTFSKVGGKPVDTHHIDFNKLNNSPDNLWKISKADHTIIHNNDRGQHHLAEYTRNFWKTATQEEKNHQLRGVYAKKPKVAELMLEDNKDWYNSRSYTGSVTVMMKFIKSLEKYNLEFNKENWNKYKPFRQFVTWEMIEPTYLLTPEQLFELTKPMEFESELFDLSLPFNERPETIEQNKNFGESVRRRFQEDEEYLKEHSKRQKKTMTRLNKDPEVIAMQQKAKLINKFKSVNYENLALQADNLKDYINLINSSISKGRGLSIESFIKYFGEKSVSEVVEIVKYWNHKVVKIEKIQCEPEWVYDIQTSTGNFVVHKNECTGVLVGNCTFGILYGKGVESLALDLTNGDIDKAQKLLDIYFKSFPKVKDWIDQKHAEIDRNKNFVKGYFGQKLMIDPNQKGNGARRNAQNAPIQSLGSLIAGTSMYFLSEEADRKIYNKPFGFTHDAYDDIIKIDDVIDYMSLLQYKLSDEPIEKLGIPLFIDAEVGSDGLNMCGIEVKEQNEKGVKVILKGTQEALENLLSIFSLAKKYRIANVTDLGTDTETYGYKDLFTIGKALKYEWGKTITSTKLELELVYN